MKINRILTLALCTLTAGAASVAQAQEKPERTRPGAEARGPMRDLSPEERQKLMDAMDKVRDEDAVKESHKSVREAMQAHRKLLREAVLKADPSLEATLDKLGEAFPPPQRAGRQGPPKDKDGKRPKRDRKSTPDAGGDE